MVGSLARQAFVGLPVDSVKRGRLGIGASPSLGWSGSPQWRVLPPWGSGNTGSKIDAKSGVEDVPDIQPIYPARQSPNLVHKLTSGSAAAQIVTLSSRQSVRFPIFWRKNALAEQRQHYGTFQGGKIRHRVNRLCEQWWSE
jgi:hypothetical protein